jgi:molecular chaperone GrpE
MIQNEEARRQEGSEQARAESGEERAEAGTEFAGADESPDRPATAAPEEAAAEDPAAALEAARTEAEGQRERALRAVAELENVRRRAERDVEKAHRYGVERFARELLAVKDSLELGLQTARDGDDDAVREGLTATVKLLGQCFEKFGIEEIDPVGDPFDPEAHEAMATQPSAEAAPDTVLMVIQKGYRLHERLLRPARVIVARTPE